MVMTTCPLQTIFHYFLTKYFLFIFTLSSFYSIVQSSQFLFYATCLNRTMVLVIKSKIEILQDTRSGKIDAQKSEKGCFLPILFGHLASVDFVKIVF